MKGKSKHNLIKNLILICSCLFLVVGLTGLIINLSQTKSIKDNEFNTNTNSYVSGQYGIKSVNLPSNSNSVTMTDAVLNSMATDYSQSNTYITISTSKELYEFSYYCNNPETKSFYLRQKYKLNCNIDYAEKYVENGIEREASFFIPVAWDSTGPAFSGEFDGQGYEISNLSFVRFSDIAGTSSSIATTYANMKYLAMFCNNSGTIKNLGLNQSYLTISVNIQKLSTTGGVSNLVGYNSGIVTNCFYKDLRDTITSEIGIAAFGGYQVSGLVFENAGTVSNSYIAVSNVLNYTVTDYDLIAEVIAKNSGTISNVYFYDSSIFRCTESEIVYRDNLFETNNYTAGKQLYGTYVASTEALRQAFLDKAGWYSYISYPTVYQDYLKTRINTPIHRGISFDNDNNALIASTADYLYMYELFNADTHFATSVTYIITSDINLENVPSKQYYYKRVISSTIKGLDEKTSGNAVVTLSNNSVSTYPTIYNFNPVDTDRIVVTAGVDTYGLFPYISGEISKLNIVPTTSQIELADAKTTSTNAKGIGTVTGYSEKGLIKDVNVFANYKYSKNVDLGEYYFGGIAGLLGGEGSITTSTVGGTINISNVSTSLDSSQSTFTGGIGIGGVVGYVTDTYGSLDTLLNNASIMVSPANAETKYQVGGIAGACYANNINKLENRGTITIGQSSATPTYSLLYVSGVIGRLLGVTKQIDNLTNQGAITTYLNSQASLNLVSGVLNADIVTASTAKATMKASNTQGNLVLSTHKSNSGKYLFWAAGITNAAPVSVNNASQNLYYTDVINVYTSNGFDTKLTGVYNLNYSDIDSTKTYITATTIDMSIVSQYAPVVNVINGSNTTSKTDLQTVYNLKNVVFMVANDFTSTNMLYSGVVNGKNVNYIDVRNEGNLVFNFSANLTATSLKINGVFEELSSNCKAKNIYNGGNITISCNQSTNSKINNTYISGICYANKNGYTDASYTEYNPLSDKFDYNLDGDLANAINKGNILVDEQGAARDNNQVNNIDGNVRIAGITNYNEAIISSAFNLGDITLNSYSSGGKYLDCAGIVALSSGKYAQIRDCANNGTIKNINMSTQNCRIVAAGILARNNRTEAQGDYTSNLANANSQGSIVFTINYGSIIGFNKRATSFSTATYVEPYSNASGIVGVGLCNTINTVNYANIFGSENISGIFGAINFNQYNSEVTENQKMYLANSINYGTVYTIVHRYAVGGVPTDIKYDEITSVELDSNRSENIVKGILITVSTDTYYGSCISLINYDNNSNAQYLNIRYLINLNDVASMIAYEINIPTTVAGATSTMFSAKQNDKYLNSNVVYAPLNNITSIEATGLFSDDFLFRQAIEGKLQLNTTTNPTDAFLTDYFQFVGYSKVNENLLNSIGWKTIAYNDAAKRFAENLKALTTLMGEYDSVNSTSYDTLLAGAFNRESWVTNCSISILNDLLPDVLDSQNTLMLKDIISYLFFESNYNTEISLALRQQVVDIMVNYIDQNNNDQQLKNILDGLMYPELLAKIVAESDSDYQTIKNVVREDISELTTSQKLELLNNYITLIDNNTYFVELFGNSTYSAYYTNQKYNVLYELLNSLNPTMLGELELQLDSSNYSESMLLKYALDNMTNSEKSQLFNNIFQNRNRNNTQTFNEATTSLLSQMNFNTKEDTYFTSNVASYFKNNYFTSDSNYVETWNKIKNDENVQNYLLSRFGYVQDSLNNIHKGIYAKATEYRNTYQTNDKPNGATYTVNSDGTVSTTFADNNTRILISTAYNDDNRRTLITNRFIYVPDDLVSDEYTYSTAGTGVKTYYYGPFVTAPEVYSTTTGNSALTPTTGTMWNWWKTQSGKTERVGSTLKGFKLNSNQNASGENSAVRRYVPLFVGIDENYVANLTGGSLGSSYFKFIWNDVGDGTAVKQWVSEEITTGSQSNNNKYVLKKDTSSSYTSANRNWYGWQTGTTYNYRYYTYDQNGNGTAQNLNAADTYYYNYSTVGLTTHFGDIYNGIIYDNVGNKEAGWSANDVLWGYLTANVITGIYYEQDMWGQYGAFITAKDDFGVITTQYIDYSLDDLIALDGRRTKGLSTARTQDEDEVEIIKYLMDHYLLDEDLGRKVVIKAVGNELKKDKYSDTALITFVNSFYQSNNYEFMNDFLENIPTTSSSYNLVINSYNQTIKTYLTNIFNNNVLPTLSTVDKMILRTADNRTNMKILMKYFYDKDYGYYSYLSGLTSLYNVLSLYDNQENKIIYDYVNDNSTKTNTELSNIITTATDTYINNFITDYNNLNDVTTINNPSLSGYTVTNAKVELADATYDSMKYSTKFVSADSTNGYSITFTTQPALIRVVAAGSGQLSDGNEVYSVSQTIDSYIFDGTSNANITINASNGVEIYAINTYSGETVNVPSYSNLSASNWSTTTNQGTTIDEISFTNCIFTNGSSDAVFTILEPSVTSIVVYCRGSNANTKMQYSFNNGDQTTTVDVGQNGIAITLNLGNNNLTYGSTITFNRNNSGTLRIYGVMVNSNDSNVLYKFTGNTTVTRDGHEMKLAQIPEATYFTYDFNMVAIIKGSPEFIGDIFLSPQGGLDVITYDQNPTYTVYNTLSNVMTSTYFTNNYLKNTYYKTIFGIDKYTTNEIEKYVFNKQYSDSYYVLDTGTTTGNITSSREFGKYTFNGTSGTPIVISNANNEYVEGASFTKKVTLNAYSTSTNGSISFNIPSAAKVFVVAKANGSTLGNLYVANASTTYGSYINNSTNTYEFSLSSGTYSIYSNCALDIYAITIVLNNDLAALNSDYQNIGTKGTNIINALKDASYTESNYANFKSYHDYLDRLHTYSSNPNTNTYYDEEVILFALTQQTDINLYNLFSNSTIVDILKKLGYKLDEVFGKVNSSTVTGLLNYIDEATAKSIITTIAKSNSNLLKEAIIHSTLNSTTVTNASKLERELVAAYVSTDFLIKFEGNTYANSYMNTIVEAINSNYDFITDQNTISTTEFLALMEHLGVDVATDGYGIFALASSHGIQNGTFIPDNIDLTSLDAKYKRLANSTYYELTDTNSTSWRDFTGLSTSSYYDVSNQNSVNYAIREEMKQLKLSISTTIFELDLVYNNSFNINATEGQIDLVNKVITYNVSPEMYNAIKNKSSLAIANIRIAESANYTSNLSNITWNVDDANSTISFDNAIIVTAEDTTVKTNYKIVIKSINIDFTFSYVSTTYVDNQGKVVTSTNAMNIPYYGATVKFKFTGTNFSKGFDIKNHFFIGTGQTIQTALEKGLYWEFTPGVINNGIVDETGDAYLSVDVFQSMVQGRKYFSIQFFNASNTTRKNVQITKNANNAADILAFAYDGNDLISSMTSSQKATSNILFGRAFTYQELTDYNSDLFYLYDFKFSDNASVDITATKTEKNGIMTYTVTYVVTSESGSNVKTYTHTLKEVSPYSTDDVYAYLYRDGYTHEPYLEPFEGMPSNGSSSLTYTNGKANYVAVYFNRGYDYQYRIRYVLNNFYIVNRDENFGASDATQANGSSILESYAGLTVSVTEGQNPNTYKFEYVYTNTSTWNMPASYVSAVGKQFDSNEQYYYYDDSENAYIPVEDAGIIIDEENYEDYQDLLFIFSAGETSNYTRTYTFPALYVIKDYAIDALISRLTFLDESIVLGDTATVMSASHPLVPTDSNGETYNANYEGIGRVSNNSGVEWTYNDAFSNSTGITIKTTSISYNTLTSAKDVTDYYALGTVSDSDLTYYSPTFAIDKYAQIYKYITLNKMVNYGNDLPDRQVLTDHNNRYIYVPFDYTNGNKTNTDVYLVQLEDGTNKWLKVYKTSYTGDASETPVYEYQNDVTTSNAKTVESGFTYDGKSYTVSPLAGTTNSENISLYMDYIGNPAEGHFWYISYAVFSEYYLENGITDLNNDGEDDLGAVKYYHISIIDATNTIYFEVELYAPTDFDINEVYLTIAENIYDKENSLSGNRQISAYAIQDYEYTEVALTSDTYQVDTYYIQNRDSTYSLATGSFDSLETYYRRGNIAISNKYDKIDISTMNQEKFSNGTYYTYAEYTLAEVDEASFASGTYYTYAEYKKINISQSMFIPNTYYVYNNGTYTLAAEFDSNAEYYKMAPSYTVALEYEANTEYYEKTNTYTLATEYVAGTQYYKKSMSYGLVKYTLRYSLAVLPKGCFYFYLDLPTGYIAKCVTDMENQLSKQTQTISGSDKTIKDEEEGSFVPYTSILTQTVNLEIIVLKGSGADASAWAVSTSDLYTRQIEYLGNSWE